MIKVDKINKQILEILQDDSSISNIDLAKKVGLAPASTLERVKKLENNGAIKGYTALVDREMLGYSLTVFIEISLSDHSATAIAAFKEAVKDIPEILECHHVAGDRDFLLKAVAKDMKSYESLAVEKLAIIPNLGRVSSVFTLSSSKETNIIPI